MQHRIAVPSADFIRNIGHWQNEALRRPISITHHGRERLVLAAADEFSARTEMDSQAEASLVELRADAEAVLENLEDGFLAFDADLKVKRSNTIAEAFVARSRDQLIGAFVANLLPPPIGLVFSERL